MDYPADWEDAKIGDILKILHGKNQRAVESINGQYPILGTGGIIGKATKPLCDWECVLIGRKGTIDQPYYMNEPFWTIDTLYYSKPEKNQCVKYQYYLFCSINWYDYAESSGRPSLTRKAIEEIKIKLPPLVEQKAIADTLETFDAHIKNLSELIEKKKAIRDGALDDLMTGRTRLKGFSGDWEVKKLGEIGYTYSGLTGKTKSDFEIGSGKFITFLNVLNNIAIDINILGKVNIKENEKQNNVKVGDLFFNTSSETPEEVGMCAALLSDPGICYLNSFCFGYRLKNYDISPLFISYYFNSGVGREFMKKHAQGSTRYNLSKQNFLEEAIPLPPLAEQKAIAETLTAFDDEIKALEAERDKIIKIRDGAMNDLLTGKIRLKF